MVAVLMFRTRISLLLNIVCWNSILTGCFILEYPCCLDMVYWNIFTVWICCAGMSLLTAYFIPELHTDCIFFYWIRSYCSEVFHWYRFCPADMSYWLRFYWNRSYCADYIYFLLKLLLLRWPFLIEIILLGWFICYWTRVLLHWQVVTGLYFTEYFLLKSLLLD